MLHPGSVSIRQKLTDCAEGLGVVVAAALLPAQRPLRIPLSDYILWHLPEAKLDILLAHHSSLEAQLLGPGELLNSCIRASSPNLNPLSRRRQNLPRRRAVLPVSMR